jgi:riboflavin biosynthesis pyrimidine reductase
VTAAAEPIAPVVAMDVLFDRAIDDAGPVRGREIPEALAGRYGGPLLIPLRPDRPTVVANFVSTLDGIVALGKGDLAGGGLISGFHEPDRFVMALLRAVADVVVVGAGTLRGSSNQVWTPRHLKPDLAAVLSAWRRAMGLDPQPTTVVVSGSGSLPAHHPGLRDPGVPVVIATTPDGAATLRRADLGAHVTIASIGHGTPLTGTDILGLVASLGGRVALSEGGPHLLAELVADDLLDELYLTIAPQLVGRVGGRLGLVEGIGFRPGDARWQDLVSVRRSDHHLFLRYRRSARSVGQES